MFTSNKYTSYYNFIVDNAKIQNRNKNDGNYYENHHIIPRSIGGNNDKENMVLLSFREHFLCHWLLTKMVSGDNVFKMNAAFYRMSTSSKFNTRKIGSRQFEIMKSYNKKTRLKYSEDRKNKHSEAIKKSWIGASERRLALSERAKNQNKGVPRNSETIEKISKSLSGVKHTEERNARKSVRQKKNWLLTFRDNSQLLVTDLNAFCIENNYNPSSISNLKSKRIKFYKDIIQAEKL